MSEKPIRVQLSRKKGWRMPPNTKKVDRTSRWGNPYAVSDYGRDRAIQLFRNTMYGFWSAALFDDDPDGQMLQAYRTHTEFLKSHGHLMTQTLARADLRGKNLACWCPLDKLCHADVLLEIANAEP